jgi:hypothetical protein
MKSTLTILLLAVASTLLVPSIVSAASGGKGVPAKCKFPNEGYNTKACCVARAVAGGGERSRAEYWCLHHGFTG